MIKLQLWDFGGQKKFRPLLKTYIKGSQAIILVYDITDESSFLAINDLIKEIKNNENNSILVLVGQKCDSEERIINEERGRELANELGIEFFEISAKNGYKVEELFNYLIQQCIFSSNAGSADLGAI